MCLISHDKHMCARAHQHYGVIPHMASFSCSAAAEVCSELLLIMVMHSSVFCFCCIFDPKNHLLLGLLHSGG